MNQALLQIWDVCIFRRGPQDLPNSYYFLGLLILGGYIVDLRLLQLVLSNPSEFWFFRPAIWFILYGTIVFALLRMRQVPQRFVQTFIALNGTSLYLSALSLVIFTFAQGIASLLIFGIVVWQVFIHGRILSAAMQSSFLFGVIVPISLIFIMDLLVLTLF